MNQSIQDIVPPKQRSIRNITSSHNRTRRPTRHLPEEDMAPPSPPRPPRRTVLPRFFSRFGIWIVVLAVLLIFIIAFSLLFSGSKVIVTPKQKQVLIEGQFEARKDGTAAGVLIYELMTIADRSVSKVVTATGEEEVEERASGTIIIFNDFSSRDQRLIKNTRFETPEGLVYRIDKSIVVPGQSEKGGETIPGSIEAVVYADEPGESYNIGLSDFTIPGFKGDPRFDSFFARSKTPMAGGFAGIRRTIDEAVLSETVLELRNQLTEDLKEEALAQQPEGFVLFDDALFVVENPIQTKSAQGDDKAEATLTATLYGVLFEEEAFARFVARNTVAGFDNESVSLLNPKALSFSILNKSEVLPQAEDAVVPFTLSGNAHVVWTFDEMGLANDLSGRSKEALSTILSGYTSIEQAEVVLRPFWKQSFPEEASKIEIEQIIPSEEL